ncbi:hypothetical protein [Halopiger xanaduensis]|uniref:Uncharacterized protein n=1 Tax=Halopiger xanaduensis (strain DSM 18323 / JCM 14033 / SH-6) TaxID=797210 RepID=F8DDI3_HALXS|nr:hypothetical protein [Halopiger xanaduensis]AEH39077.1 hypothetical protein Halxa_0476 [Halopiger xanaduensis SH-6]
MSNPFDDLKADDEPSTESESESESVSDSDDDQSAAESTDSVDADAATSTTETTASDSSEPSDDDTNSSQSSQRDEPNDATTSDGTEEEQQSPAETGPAFEYSEVRQKPLYARDETWNELEDELGITVTPELRRMGIRDEETREIHDALLKVAIEHIDEVPDTIAEVRRQSS